MRGRDTVVHLAFHRTGLGIGSLSDWDTGLLHPDDPFACGGCPSKLQTIRGGLNTIGGMITMGGLIKMGRLIAVCWGGSLLQSVEPWESSPAPHLRTVVLHRWILLFGVMSFSELVEDLSHKDDV